MSDERPERPDVDGPDSAPDAEEPRLDDPVDDTVAEAEPVVEHDDEVDLDDHDDADYDDAEHDDADHDGEGHDEEDQPEERPLSAVAAAIAGVRRPAAVQDESGQDEGAQDEGGEPDPDDLETGDGHDDALTDDDVTDEHLAAADRHEEHEEHEDQGEWDDAPFAAAAPSAHDGLDGPDGPADPGAAAQERPRRRGRWALLTAVVVLAGLYVGGYVLTGTRMPADASIGGVDVGGLSPAAARAALDEELTPREGDPVTLTHDDESFEIDPAEAGLALDVDASVDRAGGVRSWDPRDMVALFLGSHEHAPALDVDDEALAAAVEGVAEAVDVPVTEALITFPKAEPKPRAPEAGLVVRKRDTAQLVQDEYLVQSEPAEVPTAVVEPTVDEDGLRRAMTEVAEPAVAAPVVIEVGDTEVDLPVTAYAPALTVEPVDGAMAPVIDAEELAEPLTDATTGIGKKAVDATVVIRDGKPEVVPGKEGVGLQPEEMAEKLVPVLTETGDARTVEVEAKVVEPVFTTEDAKALNITEKISEFTTEYPHAEYRNINQGRAAEILNGTILKPGEMFSFNDTVGERTAANGFTSGSVINNGRFQDELGGGVSQVVTTTYNAAFFAGLEDVEHHPHAFYIDRYPVGREATVYFGSLDLRFRNNLENGVLIRSFVQRSSPGGVGRMTVQMWGTKEFDVEAGQSARRNFRSPATRYDDSDDCVPQAPLRGFDIDIYRTLSKGGKVVERETDTANYQAAARIICGEEPDED